MSPQWKPGCECEVCNCETRDPMICADCHVDEVEKAIARERKRIAERLRFELREASAKRGSELVIPYDAVFVALEGLADELDPPQANTDKTVKP